MKIGRLRIEMDEKVETEVVDENGKPVEQQPEEKKGRKILKKVGIGLAAVGAVAGATFAILGRSGKSDDPDTDDGGDDFDHFDDDPEPADDGKDFTEVDA